MKKYIDNLFYICRCGQFLLVFSFIAINAWAADAGRQVADSRFDTVQKIAKSVELIRGLEFTNRVNVALQSPAEFQDFIRKQIDKQFEDQNPDYYVNALVKMGALEKSFDFNDWIYEFLQEQASAHYVPGKDTYYLIQTNLNSLMLDVVTSHELCHALQDHNFDVGQFIEGDMASVRNNGDRAAARQSLVEGEATWVMTAWMFMNQIGYNDPEMVSGMVSMALKAQAALGYKDIMALSGGMETGEAGGMSGIGNFDLEKHPRFFVQQLMATYIEGAVMVDHVRSMGGWDLVSSLYYDNPIESTEQVLHPEKLVGKVKDSPVEVRVMGPGKSLPHSWSMVEEDVMGELGIRVLFDVWKNGEKGGVDPVSIAEGWGGDRYYYYVDDENGAELLIWKTVWDDESEASEFAAGYRMMLAGRFPELKTVDRKIGAGSDFAWQVWEVEPGRFVKLASFGNVVGIVDAGCTQLLRLVWK